MARACVTAFFWYGGIMGCAGTLWATGEYLEIVVLFVEYGCTRQKKIPDQVRGTLFSIYILPSKFTPTVFFLALLWWDNCPIIWGCNSTAHLCSLAPFMFFFFHAEVVARQELGQYLHFHVAFFYLGIQYRHCMALGALNNWRRIHFTSYSD